MKSFCLFHKDANGGRKLRGGGNQITQAVELVFVCVYAHCTFGQYFPVLSGQWVENG